MQTPSSPLETLRQLKEMLDAGALTPAEFDVLKQRLIFPDVPPVPPRAAFETPLPPTAVVPPAPLPTVAPPAPLPEPPAPMSREVYFASEASSVAPVATAWAAPQPEITPEPEAASESAWTEPEFIEPVAPPKHNPLALILSISGLLALLGLVLYLSLNRHPSEHISSISQTAADSVRTTIETGPQAGLPPAAAMPETLRVAPAHPAVPIRPRPALARPDSAVAPASVPLAPADSVAKP